MSEEEYLENTITATYVELNISGIFPELGNGSRGTTSNGWCGNFRGFKQYRKTFENENIV